MPDMFDLLVAAAYFVLAAIVFHRAMPAARPFGRMRALRFWNLAVATGLFGLAVLFPAKWIYDCAHVFLIVYLVQRVLSILKHRPERWGKCS